MPLPSLLVALFAGLLALPAFAGECIDYAAYLRLTGGALSHDRALDVAVAEPYAYVADGFAGLQVFEVTNPASPHLVASVPTSDFAQGVAVAGDRVVVAAGSAGFLVFDRTLPAALELTATVASTYAQGVALDGVRAGLAEADSVRFADLTDLHAPYVLGGVAAAGPARGVTFAGELALAALDHAGIAVISLSDPAHPVVIGALDTPGLAQALWVAGDRVYVADAWAGITIVDLVDPALPVAIGQFAVRDQALDVAGREDLLFVSDLHQGLAVFDVSHPGTPWLAGRVQTPSHAYGVALGTAHAYVADYGSGLQVAAIDPAISPPPLAGLAMAAGEEAAETDGLVGLAAGIAGLQVIELGASGAPELRSSIELADPALGVAMGTKAAYVTGTTSFTIVDLADPDAPALAGALPLLGSPGQVAYADSLACVAAGFAGACVIDVTHSDAPALLSVAPTAGFAFGVAVRGTTMAVAAEEAGLELFDLSDPRAPAAAGQVHMTYPALGVAIAGDLAYVATRIPSKHTSLGRLEVVRLTGPGAPALAGGLELPSGATSVAVGGNFAYLTDELSGLFVVDVVSPIAPRLIGASGLPVGAKACHFTGDHLLLVDRDGLTVHRPQCGSVQPVTLASLTAELEPGGSVRLQFYAAPDGGFLQFDVERAPARTGPPPNGFVRIASLPVDGPRAGWREVRDAPPPGAAYAYRVTAIGSDGSRERLGPIVVEVPAAREAVRLAVWPNPAGAGTAIRIASSADGPGVLAVFDVTGRRVAELWSGSLAPGSHVFRWDGRDAGGRLLPNGAYFVRWQTARSERSERLTIIR